MNEIMLSNEWFSVLYNNYISITHNIDRNSVYLIYLVCIINNIFLYICVIKLKVMPLNTYTQTKIMTIIQPLSGVWSVCLLLRLLLKLSTPLLFLLTLLNLIYGHFFLSFLHTKRKNATRSTSSLLASCMFMFADCCCCSWMTNA